MRFHWLVILLAGCSVEFSSAQTVLSQFPANLQLYPRTRSNNLARVAVAGAVNNASFDTALLKVLRNGVPWTNVNTTLVFSNGQALFDASTSIPAELAGYDFQLVLKTGATETIIRTATNVVAGDVFFANGQSNCNAPRRNGDVMDAKTNEMIFLRSFGARAESEGNRYSDTNTIWYQAEGVLDDGPGAVGQLCIHLGRMLVDKYQVPIALLNGARSGMPIAYFGRNDQQPEDLDSNYGRMLWRCRQAGLDKSIRGIIYYQGESDVGETAHSHPNGWFKLFADWQQDFPSLEKVFLYQLHVGCPIYKTALDVREFQRRLLDYSPAIEVMSTSGIDLWLPDNCHYSYDGYRTLAERMFKLVERDLYGAAPTNNIEAPNPAFAYFTGPDRRQINILMRQTNDTLNFTPGAHRDFWVDGSAAIITNGTATGRTLSLFLDREPGNPTGVSYGAHDNYDDTRTNLALGGPWVTNSGGVGLLAFANLPILSAANAAPAVPAFLTPSAIGSNRIDLSWLIASNAVSYRVRRDGADLGATVSPSFADTTVTCGIPHSYQVASVSAVSTSAWTAAVSATTRPENVFAFVPEATNFIPLYALDIPGNLYLGSNGVPPYSLDNSAAFTAPFDRVAYYLELQENVGSPLQWVYVSCDPFTLNPAKLGVPAYITGAQFQQPLTNMNIFASANSGIVTGTNLSTGNLEFWPWNYSPTNAAAVPNASSTYDDVGDMMLVTNLVTRTDGSYGSMQIHNYSVSGSTNTQVLFAYNRWGKHFFYTGTTDGDDLGIGNYIFWDTPNRDWTDTRNAIHYTRKRLLVLARPTVPANQTGPLVSRRTSPSRITLLFDCPANGTGTLYTTTNLMNPNWQSLAAGLPGTGGRLFFNDDSATNRAQFYRVVISGP